MSELTKRDLVMIQQIADGWTTQEIADAHFRHTRTVDSRICVLLELAGARNRPHLVAIAYRKGWIT